MVQEGIREASNFTLPDKKYFKIGETSTLLGVKPHVLRYWETEFPQVRPYKSKTGQRLYRRRDVEALIKIQKLLYEERFTIAGARKVLRLNNWNEVSPEINQEDILAKVETAVANESVQNIEPIIEVAAQEQVSESASTKQNELVVNEPETLIFESSVEVELAVDNKLPSTESEIHLAATTTITESAKVAITFDAASADGAGEFEITRTVVETITVDGPNTVAPTTVLLESAEVSLKANIDETSDEDAPEIIKAALQEEPSLTYVNAAVSNAHAVKEAIANKIDVVAECAAQASLANVSESEIEAEFAVEAAVTETVIADSVATVAIPEEKVAAEADTVSNSAVEETISAQTAHADKNEMDADMSRILSMPLLTLQKELHEILRLLDSIE